MWMMMMTREMLRMLLELRSIETKAGRNRRRGFVIYSSRTLRLVFAGRAGSLISTVLNCVATRSQTFDLNAAINVSRLTQPVGDRL